MQTTVELDLGTVEVRDTGGDGPPVLFVHGALVDAALWDDTVEHLARSGARCIQPTLPIGAHTIPVRDRAGLTPIGVSRAVGHLLERLDLRATTIVANDTGGAITQLLMAQHPDRVGAVVLTNCDAFENFVPPAVRPFVWMARARVLGLALQTLRSRRVRSSPLFAGLLTRRPIDPELLESWSRPLLGSREIRRDITRFAAAIDRRDLLAVTGDLGRFERPVLLAWGRDDRFYRPSFAQRLADLFPNSRLELIEDCTTFVPLDQPERLAALIREMVPGRPERASEPMEVAE